ncbi:MAG: PCMD domain-containing protein [Prevotella sp.]|jgi:hypothetical protein|nr:PCMD domain-containing protein [Prevotella sp.]
MRKFYTLLVVAMTAITASATDYKVPVTVIVNGVTSEQTGDFTVVENGGLYDITLKNFILQSEDGPMGVGNVELKGIVPYIDGDATLLVATDEVKITDGDDPNVPVWMASMLPPVAVELRGKIEGDQLRCYLDINLMESLGQMIQVAIGSGYQLPNPSFEAWHTSAETFVEPNGWHSFESATGDFALLAGHHLEKSADAHSGVASARVFSTSIFGIIANGTMTTGRMNAGAMIAVDPANNAYLDMSKTDADGNGDPFYVPLCSRPDSVALWVKFKQGTPNTEHPYATVSAIITDGTYYQDPEDKDYTNVVAKAKDNKIATTDGKWVRISAPFDYTKNSIDPKAVLVTVSTNADAGQGSGEDEVLVDDIAFIYNAKVTSLKIKGQDVPGFSPDKMDYEMELNEAIKAEDIEVTVEGKSAHVVKGVQAIDDYYLCAVYAIGGDMATVSAYTIKVKSSAAGISNLQSATNLPVTYFTLDGRQTKTLVPGRIYICRQADGTVTKIRP